MMDASTNTKTQGPKCASVSGCFHVVLLWVNLLCLIYVVSIYSNVALHLANSDTTTKINTTTTTNNKINDTTLANVTSNMTTELAIESLAGNEKAPGWIHNGIVYGLVHVAKVAGTEINGMLALKYERVCGNKGNSFDYFEANKRMATFKAHKGTKSNALALPDDFIRKTRKHGGRTRLDLDIMVESGFDDCDYIALEVGAKYWESLYQKYKMELHMPCRDPLSHLMSSCNFHEFMRGHKAKVFNCNNPNLAEEIKKCSVYLDDRAGAVLNFTNNNGEGPNGVSLKCFNPIPPQRYVNYMGNFMQEKRIQADYVHISTNSPRRKDRECIWKQSKEWQQNLIEIMKKTHYYYRFCDQCMGSPDELPLPEISSLSTTK